MTTTPEPAAAALERIRTADPGRPFVVAQLGQSLDGRIATPSGESRWINGEAALDHVHRLRAAVDAVVVGIGTALADDPLLNVRRVVGRNPARVVVDPRRRLPPTARCLDAADGARRVLVVAAAPALPPFPLPGGVGGGGANVHSRSPERDSTDTISSPPPTPPRKGEGSPTAAVETVEVDRDQNFLMPPQIIVQALYQRGLKRLLIEGGAGTVSAFLAAGAVDRLHVLVAPMILGSGTTGLSLPPLARLADAIRPPTDVHVLASGDVLFDCDLRSVQSRS
jgi:riboflavin biosynthesis pyrimidine reductase